MSLHIGVVACSAEGAALCYRTICLEGSRLLGPHAHPEVSIHTPSMALSKCATAARRRPPRCHVARYDSTQLVSGRASVVGLH